MKLEIEDLFEEWDDDDLRGIGLETSLRKKTDRMKWTKKKYPKKLRAPEIAKTTIMFQFHSSVTNAKKVYHIRGRLKKHEDSSSETTKKQPRNPKMSAYQKKTRVILTCRGFEGGT